MTLRRYSEPDIAGPGSTARSSHARENTRADDGGCRMEEFRWPDCMKCNKGHLIPLSDYGRDGAPITYKAWVCTNPDCGFNLRIDNGEISFGRAIGQSYK